MKKKTTSSPPLTLKIILKFELYGNHSSLSSFPSLTFTKSIWTSILLFCFLNSLFLQRINAQLDDHLNDHLQNYTRNGQQGDSKKPPSANGATNLRKTCVNDSNCEIPLSLEIGQSNQGKLICSGEGFCQKQSNSSIDENENVQDEQQKTKTNRKPSLHMIFIMAILGIMFIGICVALHLFSRARFKKRRGIFTNPRLLEMANAHRSSSQHHHHHLRRPSSHQRRKSSTGSLHRIHHHIHHNRNQNHDIPMTPRQHSSMNVSHIDLDFINTPSPPTSSIKNYSPPSIAFSTPSPINDEPNKI